MKPLFNHSLFTSFAMYLNNGLQNGAQAYVNLTTGFYYQNNPSVSGWVYASPFKNLVYDSCVSGATIISGVYNSAGQFLTRSSGIVIDYNDGRIVSQRNLGPSVSGSFARSEYGIYFSDQGEVSFWLEKVMGGNKDLPYPTNTGGSPTAFQAPCVVVTNVAENNSPFAIGGMDQTNVTYRLFIISNNAWQQEGVNSYVRDLARTNFAMATYGDFPIGGSGDLKTGAYWCYNDVCTKYGANGAQVAEVYANKVSQRKNNTASFFVSVIDVDVNVVRLPRQSK